MAIGQTWFEIWNFAPECNEPVLVGRFNTLPTEALKQHWNIFACELGADGKVYGEAL